MGRLRGRPTRGQEIVQPLVEEVKQPAIEANENKKTQRLKPLPKGARVVDVKEYDPEQQAHFEHRKTQEFIELKVTSSKGKVYTIVAPSSYAPNVPRVWQWNAERYRVAELIAQGVPLAQIPDDPQVTIRSRMIIYCWLEHPEFKEHVDGLVMETGWASRRERLNNLKRLNDIVFNKVAKEIDSMKLTDKNVGALLGALQAGAKLIAQEKGEFIEESNVTTNMTVEGKMVNIEAKLDNYVQSKSEAEREALEREFDKVGDDIIRSMTGSKD